MAYKAGNLELELTALSSGAVSSLDTVITKLSSLSSVLHSVTKDDMKWINSFGTKIKNLSKKMNDIDWSGVDSGFNRLTVSITPFIDKVNSAQASLTAMYGVLQKVSGKKFGSVTNIASGGGTAKSINSLFNFGKITAVAYMLKRMGQSVANIVQYGTNFTETLNLWQVAMRNNLDQADEFIKKMNRAYGISQKTLMNAQATFKNMIGSLGNISDTVAYQLSESILQMATDFSSLYNVTFENAITKFQAALVGQVRPIRSESGYDITETTLYQVYQTLGGTKTQRQLNRTEKQLLAIYAVFQQMQRSGAIGDLSKTLDNFANQSRMMSENFKELKTYVGLFFQDLLQSWGVLKYINAGLIFLTEVVKALTNYKAPNFIEDMFESTVAENEAADELQGKLLDFDKFRALDSSAGVGSVLEIDQSILKAVSDYQSILENVNNEARNIATSWLEALGFTTDENGELSTTEEKLKGIKSILGIVVGAIGGVALATVANTVSFIAKGLSKIVPLLTSTSAIIMAIVVAVGYLYATNETFRNSINNLFTTLGHISKNVLDKLLPAVSDLLSVLAPIIDGVGDILAFVIGVVNELIQMLDDWGVFDYLVKVINVNLHFTKVIIVALATTFEFIVKAVQSIYTILDDIAHLRFSNIKNDLSNIWKDSNWKTQSMWNTPIIPNFAGGASNIDSGTLFVAGEMGKTEAVFTGSNGKANVANTMQMEDAFYNALVRYGRENRGTDNAIVIEVDGERLFSTTRRHANKRGLDFKRV